MNEDYCAEDGCTNIATTEYFEGMINDTLVVSLVCSIHAKDD